jgi:hypothetical protein
MVGLQPTLALLISILWSIASLAAAYLSNNFTPTNSTTKSSGNDESKLVFAQVVKINNNYNWRFSFWFFFLQKLIGYLYIN